MSVIPQCNRSENKQVPFTRRLLMLSFFMYLILTNMAGLPTGEVATHHPRTFLPPESHHAGVGTSGGSVVSEGGGGGTLANISTKILRKVLIVLKGSWT